MREFILSAEDAAAEMAELLPSGKAIRFKIGDRELEAFPPPNSGPLTRFMMHGGSVSEASAALKELLPLIMSEEDVRVIDDGLRRAEISGGMLMELLEYLLEEWSARPTGSPSGSSPRRRTTGRASTGSARSAA